jgi:hypothetical protein
MRRVRTPGSCLAIAIAAALLAACGGEEESFTAEEFVGEMRESGVEMTLGAELFSEDESKDVIEVELEPLPGGPTPEEGALENPHGSMSVHDEVAGADEQFRNCEATADLLCYQAANVVIVLEGGGLEADRLGAAMQKLED